MTRKQCIWSDNTVFFLTLLLLSTACCAVNEELFFGESVHVLERVYDFAPRRVHFIVDSLLGKAGDSPYSNNFVIFDGEPGVGKSTLAMAMAYKLGWDVQIFGVSDFLLSENRNGSSALFNRWMQEFEEAFEDNSFIIINEFNQLLTNWKSAMHDTDSSSKSFWLFLDRIKKKKNIFVVGITSGIGGFPPQIVSRFKGSIVTITAPKDLDILKENFFEYLHDEKITVSPEVRQYLENNLEILDGYTARDIGSLVNILKMQIVELSPDRYLDSKFVIDMNHLQAALNEIADLNVRFQKEPYEKIDTEQRERHHSQMLSQSKMMLSQIDWQFKINTALNCLGILVHIIGVALHSAGYEYLFNLFAAGNDHGGV